MPPYHSYILHLCDRTAWSRSQELGEYRTDSLEQIGFIHCSTVEQVLPVANQLYRGRQGLVALLIDPRRLMAELRWEQVGDQRFPHLYGPLNLDAVVDVVEVKPNPMGLFDKFPQSNQNP